ncbi:hypothetical protein Tco_0212437 [Tanacetum coccineum]
MHERPSGKVGIYTRFFDYANYRIPSSNFFVSVLAHFRIPFSQFYKSGWFGFTKRPNVRACYSKNLDSVKNWNDHFFWVDEFVVPANTADPRKVRIVERLRTENERPIVIVAKHRIVTLLPTLVARPSGELSESVEREFGDDVSGGGDQEGASAGGHGNVAPVVPTADDIVIENKAPGPKRSRKKKVTRGGEDTPATTLPPKRLRADYGRPSGPVTMGKSPSVLNRLLQDSLLSVEQGVGALPTLPFVTSSVTGSHLEEGEDHIDSIIGPSVRTVAPFTRFVVLSDSSHHSGANSAGPEVDSFVRSTALVMTEATTLTALASTTATTVAIPADIGQEKSVPALSVFGGDSSSEKTDRTLSLFTGRSGSDFIAGSIRVEGVADTGLEEVYVPEWTVTKGFELKDGRSCANMIDHFTPPFFFKTVRGMEHKQLFSEFNVSTARNLSLSSEKDNLLGAKDKEIEELKSQLLKVKDESAEDSLMKPLETRLAELDADFTKCCVRFQESFHLHLLNEGLAAGIEHGQAGRCLTDLEAYIPSAEADFNSAVRDLRGLDFPLLQQLSDKKDASTWDVMDLLRLDDVVAEALGMDRVVIGSQALSVALDICRGRVEKMKKNLIERLPFLKDIFAPLDQHLSAEALTIIPEASIEPPVVTNALSTVVIIPHSDPSVSVEDYENPDLVDVISGNAALGPEGEEMLGVPLEVTHPFLLYGITLVEACSMRA